MHSKSFYRGMRAKGGGSSSVKAFKVHVSSSLYACILLLICNARMRAKGGGSSSAKAFGVHVSSSSYACILLLICNALWVEEVPPPKGGGSLLREGGWLGAWYSVRDHTTSSTHRALHMRRRIHAYEVRGTRCETTQPPQPIEHCI